MQHSVCEIETTAEGPATDAGEWLTAGRFACILGLLVVAMFPGVVLLGQAFVIRDFGLFGYPLAFFHKESFWHGQLPLWNPLSYCGLPFLAQWNTLVLYPGTLVYLLLPLPWSLSLFCLAHQFWGGLGMYFLADRWTGNKWAAALAAVIFAFNGLTLNFLMWPNNIASFSWLPWIIWLTQTAWRQGGRKIVWATLAGALQMLAGGPEIIMATWGILFLLACGDWLSPLRLGDFRFAIRLARILPLLERVGVRGDGGSFEQQPRPQCSGLVLWARFFTVGFLVALVCAAQLLPFFELLVRSQRDAGFGYDRWSMPHWGWANFLVPLFRTRATASGMFFQDSQGWTSSYYAGIGTVWLAAVAAIKTREWRGRLLTGLVLLALVLALGDHGILYRVMRECVPMAGFARFPIKFVILVLALTPLLAAFGLTSQLGPQRKLPRLEWACALGILILIGVIIAFDSRVNEDYWPTTSSGLSRAGLLILIVTLTELFRRSHAIQRLLCGCFLIGAFWLDFTTHVPTQNPSVRPAILSPDWVKTGRNWSPAPELGKSRAITTQSAERIFASTWLSNYESGYSLYRLGLLANCNLLEGIPQAHGFFSLMPRDINDAVGVTYVRTNADFSSLLDFMGVSQISAPGKPFDWVNRPSRMPLVTAGQRVAFTDDDTVLFLFAQTNLDLRKVAFLPPEARSLICATNRVDARILSSHFDNQVVSIEAETPSSGVVVISQTYYPAWKAYLDGQPVQLWRANYAFQAVELPAGRHRIQLRYEDTMFRIGIALSIVGIGICIVLCRTGKPRRAPRELFGNPNG